MLFRDTSALVLPPLILHASPCAAAILVYTCADISSIEKHLYSIADVIFHGTSALVLHPPILLAFICALGTWFKRGIYRCTDEVVFTPCSVVIGEFDKYNLIPSVLFSCFKPPTVITEASEVITWEV